jgi:hypothetical protein
VYVGAQGCRGGPPKEWGSNADRRRSRGTATLDTITVTTRTSPASAGQSQYGLFATGSTTEIVLREVRIEAGPAGVGAAGTAGKDGTPPANVCPVGDGQEGTSAGRAGAGAPVGTFNVAGYVPAPGTRGSKGSDGSNGFAGPDPSCIECPNANPGTTATCQAVDECSQGSCRPVCHWVGRIASCGSRGTNGCGGGGGEGSGAGAGGGSSVGIFLWNAALRITDSSVSSSTGGDGGRGSNAVGRGQEGNQGAYGSPGSPCAQCEGDPARGSPCEVAPAYGASPGYVGGNGGAGRNGGGPGGGGSGGHSYAIYKGGTASVTVAPDVELTSGMRGTGAGTGSLEGADGFTKPIGP